MNIESASCVVAVCCAELGT